VANVSIKVWNGRCVLELDMPGATNAKYAAMRVAEANGCDPNDPHFLFVVSGGTSRRLNDDQIMADCNEVMLSLAHGEG